MLKIILSSIAIIAGLATASAQAETLTICTGSERGNYHYLGQVLLDHFRGDKSLEIELVNTAGSMDNLERMSSGECDGGIAQSDAWLQYAKRKGSTIEFERVGLVFTEFAHLVCNASASVGNVLDLQRNDYTLAIGKRGSGTWVTWQGVVDTEKVHGRGDLQKVRTSSKAGSRALNAVMDGTEVQCMLQVASPPHTIMTRAAQQSERSKYLRLTHFSDSTFDDTKDSRGRTIYKPGKMGPADYSEFGACCWHVDTIAVDAVFALSADWAANNDAAYEKLAFDFATVTRKVRRDKSLVLQ